MDQSGAAHFPVFKSFAEGLKPLHTHRVLFAKLCLVPFVVTLVSLVAIRFLKDDLSLFWLPVIQIPASFVTGLLCAILLRFLILGESPAVGTDGPQSPRNAAVTHAGFAYAVVTYLMTGVYAVIVSMKDAMEDAGPDAAAPYMPLAMGLMFLVVWGARYMWLNVPLALDWPVRDFFKRLGGLAGSLRVFLLFGLCSITLNFIVGLTRIFVQGLFAPLSKGLAAALGDVVVSAGTLLLAVLFTCVTSTAIEYLSGKKKDQ